jgi:hypothetical protein
VSPVCWQYEPAWQVPFTAQNPEQHWALEVHASPTPAPQPVVIAVHVPGDPPSEEQRPLQHCALPAQPCPTCAQPPATHAPLRHEPLQQSPGIAQPPPRLRQEPPASGWKSPESGSDPLEVPPELPEPPLDAASPPLLEEVPPELAPLLPLLDVVASVEPSSPVVASPLLVPDEDAPLDEPEPDEAPDELPSAPPSDVLPSPLRDPVLLLLPHPAPAIAAATHAMRAKADQWDLTLIAAPWIRGDIRRGGRRGFNFLSRRIDWQLVTRVTMCGTSCGHLGRVGKRRMARLSGRRRAGPTFA